MGLLLQPPVGMGDIARTVEEAQYPNLLKSAMCLFLPFGVTSSSWKDASFYRRNTNIGLETVGSGPLGKAFSFPGTDSTAKMTVAVGTVPANYTVLFRSNLDTTAGNYPMYLNLIGSKMLQIQRNAGTKMFVHDFVGAVTVADYAVAAGAWVTAAVRYRDGTASLWLDGKQVAEKAASNSENTRCTLYIGSYGSANLHFDGLMDFVGLWNRALDPSEIQVVSNDLFSPVRRKDISTKVFMRQHPFTNLPAYRYYTTKSLPVITPDKTLLLIEPLPTGEAASGVNLNFKNIGNRLTNLEENVAGYTTPIAVNNSYVRLNQTVNPQVGTGTLSFDKGNFINKLGIGTTSPNSPLDVRGNLNQILSLDRIDANSECGMEFRTNKVIKGYFGYAPNESLISSTAAGIKIRAKDNFYIATNDNNNRFTILSNGNVGIGANTPSYTLDVNGSGNFASGLSVTGQAYITGINTTLSQTSGDLRIITGPNKTLILDTPVYDDLRVPVTSTKAGGSKEPSFAVFKTNGAGSQGVFTYWFAGSVTEQELYFTSQMSHSWNGGTIHPHVHWVPNTNGGAGEKVQWNMEYTWSDIGTTFGNTVMISGSNHIPADNPLVAGRHYLTELNDIIPSTTQSGISSMLLCRIFRTPTYPLDTYTDTAGLLEVDFHYPIDKMGSRYETSY